MRLSYILRVFAALTILGGAGIGVVCGPGATVAWADPGEPSTAPSEPKPEPEPEPNPTAPSSPAEPPPEPTAPVEPVPPEVQQPQPAPRPVPPPRRPATPTTPSTPPAPAPAPEPEPEPTKDPEPAPEPSTESPSPEPFVFDQMDGPESHNWRPQLAIVTLAGSVGLVAVLFAARWAMRQEWFRSLGERVGIRRR